MENTAEEIDATDPAGDFAFTVLDWLLYHAVFGRGHVTLRHKRSIYPCYSVREIRRQLTAITEDVVMNKLGRLPADMDAIVTNAMDEYGGEIHKALRSHRKSA